MDASRIVQIYRPAGTVKQVALFLSGDAGWDRGMASLATALAADGSLVVGIDVPKFYAVLEKDGGNCVFPDGDLGEPQPFRSGVLQTADVLHAAADWILSRRVAAAYATLAQAPRGIFGGALSLSFCQELDLVKPLLQDRVFAVLDAEGRRSSRSAGDPACPMVSGSRFRRQGVFGQRGEAVRRAYAQREVHRAAEGGGTTIPARQTCGCRSSRTLTRS